MSILTSSRSHGLRGRTERYTPSFSERSYRLRFLLCLAGSLLLVTVCFRAPWQRALNPVGWQIASSMSEQQFDVLDVRPADNGDGPRSGAPLTTFSDSEVDEQENDQATREEEELPEPASAADVPKLQARAAVLEFSEQMPKIEGGLGAYYIHIDYPEAAIRAGIQGRLTLTFIVETDGRPSHIEVMKPLHPLCDSAAVQALRQTRFVPGRQNGEKVRVRMRLPVHFKIVDPSAETASSTETRP